MDGPELVASTFIARAERKFHVLHKACPCQLGVGGTKLAEVVVEVVKFGLQGTKMGASY